MISYIIIIIPAASFFDWKTNPNHNSAEFSTPTLVFLLSYGIFILIWHIGSSYLKEKLVKQSKIKDDDFINEYEDGYEVIADIDTFGLAKNIGYRKVKIFFACHAVAIVVFILLCVFVAFVKIELFNSILNSAFLLPVALLIYVLVIAVSWSKIDQKLK